MKKTILLTTMCAAVLALGAILMSCTGDDGVMSRKKGVYTVNTTALSQDVKGFNGPTPLLITIEKDKVTKVEALENSETPGFFKRVTDGGLLDRWNGMSVDEALGTKVDAIAGATYSSNAVIENVRLGLQYYKDHKK
ncbi:MAG: FMN-binding protein [Bacteroidales bacterium]|nr:FMN-binding protein [Bacteroidales bacterium]